jgi:hypothetical protein
VNLELLAVLLAGGSLTVSLGVLVIGWRILRSVRRAEWAGDERLEILREQRDRLRVMYQERNMLQEELERLRSALDQENRLLELPAPSELSEDPKRGSERPWWRFWG